MFVNTAVQGFVLWQHTNTKYSTHGEAPRGNPSAKFPKGKQCLAGWALASARLPCAGILALTAAASISSGGNSDGGGSNDGGGSSHDSGGSNDGGGSSNDSGNS